MFVNLLTGPTIERGDHHFAIFFEERLGSKVTNLPRKKLIYISPGNPRSSIFLLGGGLAIFSRKQKLQKFANAENLFKDIASNQRVFAFGMGPNGQPGGRDGDEQRRTAGPARGEPPASVPTHRHFDGCWKSPEYAIPQGKKIQQSVKICDLHPPPLCWCVSPRTTCY